MATAQLCSRRPLSARKSSGEECRRKPLKNSPFSAGRIRYPLCRSCVARGLSNADSMWRLDEDPRSRSVAQPARTTGNACEQAADPPYCGGEVRKWSDGRTAASVSPKRDESRQGDHPPRPLKYISHGRACRKAPILAQNRRSDQRTTSNRGREMRTFAVNLWGADGPAAGVDRG